MNKKSKITDNNSLMFYAGTSLILLSTILIIAFFLRGQMTVNGNSISIHTDLSLVCKASDIQYPIFEYDESSARETDIYIIFNNDEDEIRTISLRHTQHYDSYEKVRKSEAMNHGAINMSFQRDHYEADALGAAYSMQDDKFIFSLYANKLSSEAYKYFMLSEAAQLNPASLAEYYASNGFNCTQQGQNN